MAVVDGPPASMSQAAFATYAGVSRKTVTDWKHKGFVLLDASGKVDVARSVALLADRGYGGFGAVTQAVTPEAQVTTPDPQPDLPGTEPAQPQDDGDGRGELSAGEIAERLIASGAFELLTHAEAERMKENYLALRQRLLFEQDAKSLVSRAEVERHFETMWSEERNAWETWPSGVAADIAVQLGVDQIKVRVLLEDAVREHLLSRVRRAG